MLNNLGLTIVSMTIIPLLFLSGGCFLFAQSYRLKNQKMQRKDWKLLAKRGLLFNLIVIPVSILFIQVLELNLSLGMSYILPPNLVAFTYLVIGNTYFLKEKKECSKVNVPQ